MRQWRVGTVSMGLLLLFSGIGLLYAQFNQLTVAHVALKWWPVLFVILGIEVLVQNYFNKSGNTQAQAKLGSGTHKLTIICDDEITINQLP